MHTMAERQEFSFSAQAEDICYGDKRRSGGWDRVSGHKMCFETILPLSDLEYRLNATLSLSLFIVDESVNNHKYGCLILSNELVCLDAVHQHQVINIDSRNLKYLPHFEYINAILVNTKARLKRAYHALKFNNMLFGVLCSFPIFLVPVNNKIFHKRPVFWGDTIINPRADVWLCSSEELN